MRLRYFAAGFLAAGALFTGAWATAQSVAIERVTPRIMSGGDVGFAWKGFAAGRRSAPSWFRSMDSGSPPKSHLPD